jgi:hypothetical protein
MEHDKWYMFFCRKSKRYSGMIPTLPCTRYLVPGTWYPNNTTDPLLPSKLSSLALGIIINNEYKPLTFYILEKKKTQTGVTFKLFFVLIDVYY